MRIGTELRPCDIPAAMQWLSSQFGEQLKRRVANLESRATQNPLLNYTQRYFSLEFSLERALHHRRVTNRYPKGDSYDLAYAFAVTGSRLWEKLDHQAQRRFSGCMRDGLKGPYGLRPLAYEIQVLTHLCRRGFDVECVDLNGTANFDFLATRYGESLEIECKTTAPDAGQKVHYDDVISLGGKLMPLLKRLNDEGGFHLIRIQVPDRLHPDNTKMTKIVDLVDAAVSSGTSRSNDLATIDYRRPQVQTLQRDSELEGRVRTMFRTEFQMEAGTILIHSRIDENFVAVTVQSLKQATVFDALSRRAKDAAKQFSGTRPAVVLMQLLDMSPEVLKDAIEKPSKFYDITKEVFEDLSRSHVNSVVFTLPPSQESPHFF